MVGQKHNLVGHLILLQIFPIEQNVRCVFRLIGQFLILVGRCPMSDRYFKAWVTITFVFPFFKRHVIYDGKRKWIAKVHSFGDRILYITSYSSSFIATPCLLTFSCFSERPPRLLALPSIHEDIIINITVILNTIVILNTPFSFKTALSEANVKTNRMATIKWTYHKEWSFASNCFIFLKNLFQF